MHISSDDISTHLLKHNIKPSYPRVSIMGYLLSQKNHPTVDEIYSELLKEIPTLSKTTVYNTLTLFTDANIARVITIDGNEARYDADMSDHGHFKCENCGTIYDFSIRIAGLEAEDLSTFQVHEKNVYYKGICFKCLENNKNQH